MGNDIKKHIGTGLCIIFASCLINCILARIDITDENIIYGANTSWGQIFNIASTAAILYIAFSRKIKSNIFVKAGGTLIAVFSAIFLVNSMFLIIKHRYLIEFDNSSYLVSIIIEIASIIIFYWRIRTWGLIKIAITCQIIPRLVNYFAYQKIVNFDGDYETFDMVVQSYNDTIDLTNIIFIVIYAIALILTGLWLSNKEYGPGLPPKENTPASQQPGKPELINKIPHK